MMIVKADIDGDMRRLSVTLSEHAPALEMLEVIRAAVAEAFDMDEPSLPALKYKDEDGDLCTLVAASVEDMLDLNNRGTLRLFACSSIPAGDVKATTTGKVEVNITNTAEPLNCTVDQEGEAIVADTDTPPNSSSVESLEEERRLDPVLEQHFTYAEMCEAYRCDDFGEDDFKEHWGKLKKVDTTLNEGAEPVEAENESELRQTDAPETCRQHIDNNATKLDHVQVFISESMSAIRSQAKELFKNKRSDVWVTIPASTARPAGVQTASDVEAAADSKTEHEGAQDVPTASAQDEFLLVTDANEDSTSEQEAASPK